MQLLKAGEQNANVQLTQETGWLRAMYDGTLIGRYADLFTLDELGR
jgi:hypothetical protein